MSDSNSKSKIVFLTFLAVLIGSQSFIYLFKIENTKQIVSSII